MPKLWKLRYHQIEALECRAAIYIARVVEAFSRNGIGVIISVHLSYSSILCFLHCDRGDGGGRRGRGDFSGRQRRSNREQGFGGGPAGVGGGTGSTGVDGNDMRVLVVRNVSDRHTGEGHCFEAVYSSCELMFAVFASSGLISVWPINHTSKFLPNAIFHSFLACIISKI